jgi:hypothetical protein
MRILRGLSSRFLPCGCLTGVYETYDGTVVGILDAKSDACRIASHRNGKKIPVDASVSTQFLPSDDVEQPTRD